ncbi:MAG: DUF483 domain-containing protein [Candidatus Woesearchaeota archaeon]|nr:DUF483 domain-containing protein [Candidatus Woesearchaeota archaeon]
MIEIFGSEIKSLEILSLLYDKKLVVRQGFYGHELSAVESFCKKENLHFVISVFKVRPIEKGYSNKGMLSKEGMSFVYISKDELLANKAAYFEIKEDHFNLGILLGYPRCCCSFFEKRFPYRSKLDNNYDDDVLAASPKKRYPFQMNIFKRSEDCSLLSHFPCSLGCKESLVIADAYLEVLRLQDVSRARAFESGLRCKMMGKTFF